MIFLCDENNGCSTDDLEENWKAGIFTSEANAKSAKADCASQSDVTLGWFSSWALGWGCHFCESHNIWIIR